MYVYFVKAGRNGPIKIGVAMNVKKRMETLQTGNHLKLNLIAKIKCSSKLEAYSLESQLHKKFKGKHIRGEWFSGTIRLDQVNEFDEVTKSNIDNTIENRELDRQLLASSPL